MDPLRFAAFGAGFWARFQLAAWQEVPGARCVAICDRARSKAEELARKLGVPAAYADPEELLRCEEVDFVDIIAGPEAHRPLALLCASRKVPVICQKPLAPSLEEAEEMVAACRRAGVPLLVHENWRWQAPIRRLREALAEGRIGKPFRARIEMISGFPVFRNQPSLRELEQFILADMGTHILDAARFLFGEPESLYCRTHRVHPDIRGEDVATVALETAEATVVCAMAYAENHLERERFPETFVFVEGSAGSAELAPDYWVRVTTAEGTHSSRHPPPRYSWVDPAYEVAQASMVACHRNLLSALRGEGRAETTGEDNLKTLRLVFEAYRSARTGQAVRL